MIKENVLVIGCGFIGKDLVSNLEKRNFNCLVSTTKDTKSPLYLDLTERESIEEFCKNIPTIRGVIFSAGKEPSENLENLSWGHLNEMAMVHLTGVVWCVKNLIPKTPKPQGIQREIKSEREI